MTVLSFALAAALLAQVSHGLAEARQALAIIDPSGGAVRISLSGLLPMACLAACGGQPFALLDFSREASALRGVTIPGNAQDVHVDPVTHDPSSARTSWTFETPMRWEEYAGTARAAVGTDYKEAPGRSDVLIFRRAFPGDTLTIMIELVQPGPPCRIRVSFDALAG